MSSIIMFIPKFLYQLLIAPLELVFECIFSITNGFLDNIGLSIIPLSLIVNLLLLPFYNRADQIQKEQHALEEKLAPEMEHLKKTFKGNERFMLLQTFYRQNDYSPLYALRSSFALLLEIPFFIAAYHFLSNFESLNGTSFGPLKDLGAQDGLLTVAGITINLLPILMTLINIVSSKIYAKDLSRKDEIRMYAMALFFLILLYRSPSGLVFYWTLNQVFSLIKNIIHAARKDKPLLDTEKLFGRFSKRSDGKAPAKSPVPYTRIFLASGLFLSVLSGFLIPASVIQSSPAEFVIFTEYRSPVYYLILTFALSFGFFFIWSGLFYYLSGERFRRGASFVMCILAYCGIINFSLSGNYLPFLEPSLTVSGDWVFPGKQIRFDVIILLAFIVVITLIWIRSSRILPFILVILSSCLACIGVYSTIQISRAMPPIRQILERENNREASFSLSKDGNNVVVIMMDRAISCYVPYLFNEDPTLEAQFDGFTWYPNTLSFGGSTNVGAPPLFGGYEYHPDKMNARSDVPLKDKNDEALRLMPVLFDEAGYDVTVFDPPYAGYSTIPDLSIYDDHPDIQAYLTEYGQYWDHPQNHKRQEHIWTRNFFCYGVARIMPLPVQDLFYDNGRYHDPNWITDSIYQTQYILGSHSSVGINSKFMYSYAFLQALPEVTQISDTGTDTFLMLSNCTTHDIALLSEPGYEPAMNVNNKEYDDSHQDRFTVDGKSIEMSTSSQYAHYQSNMAALRELGKWFDYLRKEGVYDNTRIIIVSDHGYYLEHMQDQILGYEQKQKIGMNIEDVLAYNAFLMVKDFGSTGFTVDNTFMTNADTPVLAFDGLISDPVNPATGNPVTNDAKNAEELYILYTNDWMPSSNNGNTFKGYLWFSLRNQNIFDIDNWKEEE